MQHTKLSEGDTDLRGLTDEVHARLDAGDTALNTVEIAAAKAPGCHKALVNPVSARRFAAEYGDTARGFISLYPTCKTTMYAKTE